MNKEKFEELKALITTLTQEETYQLFLIMMKGALDKELKRGVIK